MLEDPGNEGAASPDTTALDLMQNLTLQSPPSSSHPMLSEDENDIIDDIIEVRSPGSIAASFLDGESLLDGEQPRRELTDEEKILEERRISILLDEGTSPAEYYKFMENLAAPSVEKEAEQKDELYIVETDEAFEENSEAPHGPAEDLERVEQEKSAEIDKAMEESFESPLGTAEDIAAPSVENEAEKKNEDEKDEAEKDELYIDESDEALQESSESPRGPAEDVEHVEQEKSAEVDKAMEESSEAPLGSAQGTAAPSVEKEAEKKDEVDRAESDEALEESSEAPRGPAGDTAAPSVENEAEQKDELYIVETDEAFEENSEAPHVPAEDLERVEQEKSAEVDKAMEESSEAPRGPAENLDCVEQEEPGEIDKAMEESSEAPHGPAENLEYVEREDCAEIDKAMEESSEAPLGSAGDLDSNMDLEQEGSDGEVQDMEQEDSAEVDKAMETSGDVPASQPIQKKSLFGGGVTGLNFPDQSGNAAIEEHTRSYIKENFPPLSLDQLVANGMSHQPETSGCEASGRSPEKNQRRPGTSGGYRQAEPLGFRAGGGYSQTRSRPQGPAIASLERECEIITLDDSSSDEADPPSSVNALRNVEPVIPFRNMLFPTPPFPNQNPLISTTYNYQNINHWALRNQPPPPPPLANRPGFFPPRRGKSLNRNDIGSPWDQTPARIPNLNETNPSPNLNALRNIESVAPFRNMLFPTPPFPNQNSLISNTYNYQNINNWALRNGPGFIPQRRGKSLNRNDIGNRWDQTPARIPVFGRGRSVVPEARSLALEPRNVPSDTRSLAGSYNGGFRRHRTPTPFARRNGGDLARDNGSDLARSSSKSTHGGSRSKSRRSRRRRSSSEESSSSSDTASSYSSSRGRKRHRHKHHRKFDKAAKKLMETGFTERQIELIKAAVGQRKSKGRKKHKSHKRKKSRRHSRHHYSSSCSSEPSPRRGNSYRNRYNNRNGAPGTSGSSGRKRNSEEFGDYHRSGKRRRSSSSDSEYETRSRRGESKYMWDWKREQTPRARSRSRYR
ncbi:hypothetical protein DdX_12274 [Ditylenchus destructor]|uniref:Uncharacterized protein n=1 Tax=Ditylenchus destructor TaxID=166010 RepID=A0AAD4N0Q6_9BILA|nr:hypothetical protein DdX_12274 [Ditylenchus destructor]